MGFTPAPLAIFLYRRNFFGKHFVKLLNQSLRHTQCWSIGEVELMAAFVSKINDCPYCVKDHAAVAKNEIDEDLITAVLENYETAPIDSKLKSILAFLKKLTLHPSIVTKADLVPLRAHKLSDKAIEEAINVCALFCSINILLNALGDEVPSDKAARRAGKILYNMGYQ